MSNPIEIEPTDYSAYADHAYQAGRAREVAAARLQGRPKQSMATQYSAGSDGSSSLVQRKALNDTPASRDEFEGPPKGMGFKATKSEVTGPE